MINWVASLLIVFTGISISAVSAESIKEIYQSRKMGQGLGIPLSKPPTEACLNALKYSGSMQILLFLQGELKSVFETKIGAIEKEESGPVLINNLESPKQNHYFGKLISYLSSGNLACEGEVKFNGRMDGQIKTSPESMSYKIECFDSGFNRKLLGSILMDQRPNEEDLEASFREKIPEIQETLRKNPPAECQ